MMPRPNSSYSCLEHHRFRKVLREANIEPPIQTEYFRLGGANTWTYENKISKISAIEGNHSVKPTFMLDGARDTSSFLIRSAIPGNIVVPPDITTSEYRSCRISISHF